MSVDVTKTIVICLCALYKLTSDSIFYTGFDHLDPPNAFEECGPATNWKWSYEVKNSPIPDCIRKSQLHT